MQNIPQISELPDSLGMECDQWYGKLQGIWEELKCFPRLSEVIIIQRGTTYPSLEYSEKVLSNQSLNGAGKDQNNPASDLEPYIARPSDALRIEPKPTEAAQSSTKVIVRIRETGLVEVPRWPLVGAIDPLGLTYPQDCFALYPTAGLPVEVLAALINSPIVNAYLSIHWVTSETLPSLFQQVPVPRFDAWQMQRICKLVQNYLTIREEWLRDPFGLTGSGVLGQLDADLLGYYKLSMQAEKDLIAYFQGHRRPGPAAPAQVHASSQNALYRILIHVEGVRSEGGEKIIDAFIHGWGGGYPNKIVHFPLSLVPQRLRAKVAQNSVLNAKVNIGTRNERNLVFEDIDLEPEMSEEEFYAGLV